MLLTRKNRRGASLVEIIVTVGVLAVGLYSIGVGLQSARSGTAVAARTVLAETYATNLLEMLLASSDELRRGLADHTSIRIPESGLKPLSGNDRYRWIAEVKRLENQPAAQVEVKLFLAHGAADKPIAVVKGIVPLTKGGIQ
ncbi:MAG: hypothetical protein N2Z21_07725 [Candidatus Sumerlaeaceae bacterium]|nr:hypothetical protein [Candidatus Sumerlaeaceae bacterium]